MTTFLFTLFVTFFVVFVLFVFILAGQQKFYIPALIYEYIFEHSSFVHFHTAIKEIKQGKKIPIFPSSYLYSNDIYDMYHNSNKYYFVVYGEKISLKCGDEHVLTAFEEPLLNRLIVLMGVDKDKIFQYQMIEKKSSEIGINNLIYKYISKDADDLKKISLDEFINRFNSNIKKEVLSAIPNQTL